MRYTADELKIQTQVDSEIKNQLCKTEHVNKCPWPLWDGGRRLLVAPPH